MPGHPRTRTRGDTRTFFTWEKVGSSGENAEDQGEGHEGHHQELESRRFARHQTLLNSVLGANLEDLHCLTHHVAELECQSVLLHQTLLRPVLGEKP